MTTPTGTTDDLKLHRSPSTQFEKIIGQEEVQAIADRIEATFGGITRHKARLLYDIGVFDSLRLAPKCGAKTTAGWLIRRLGISQTTAHEYVRVARKLTRHSLLAGAFADGAVNYSKVRLLMPYLAKNDEQLLVDMARDYTYHQLEAELALFERDDEDDQAKAKPKSYVRIAERKNGRFGLWADLSPLEGAQVAAALKIGELAYHDVDLQDVVERDAVDETLDALPTSSGFGTPTGRVMLAAFMGMVNIVRSRPKNPLRTPGAHVNIVTTVDGGAYLPVGGSAASTSVAHAVANAMVRINTVNEDGLIINTSRASRLATDGQVNAMMTMWGGKCAMPGCNHSKFIELHHVHDWAAGGSTDLDNLIPLCSACHSLVSDEFIQIKADGPDYHFVFPDGTRHVSVNYRRPKREDTALTLAEYNALDDG